jgi:hypothetical protein
VGHPTIPLPQHEKEKTPKERTPISLSIHPGGPMDSWTVLECIDVKAAEEFIQKESTSGDFTIFHIICLWLAQSRSPYFENIPGSKL